MKAYRARILRFASDTGANLAHDQSAIFEEDGLLVVGPNADGRQVVLRVGDYSNLIGDFRADHPHVKVQELKDRIIAPGFVDTYESIVVCRFSNSTGDNPWLLLCRRVRL